MTLNVRNNLDQHQTSSVQNVTCLDIIEEINLSCVSRASSKESLRTFLILPWRLEDFGRQDLP